MITILIPVFNEENRLRKGLDSIFAFLKTFSEETEVLIVDDGSIDQTPKILEEYKNKFPLRVVSLTKNVGKGGAIREGIGQSKGDKILFTDIDLSVPIDFLTSFNEGLTSDIDIAIGSREHPQSEIPVKQFWLRELAGYSFTTLTNAILQVGASDFTCGFKLFRREAARKIFAKQQINRWAFDAETLFLAKKYEFKVKELPVVWMHGAGSKVRFPQDLIESFFGLLKIRINDWAGKYEY